MHRTTILVPHDLWADFGKIARDQDLGRSQLLRKLMRDEVAVHNVEPGSFISRMFGPSPQES